MRTSSRYLQGFSLVEIIVTVSVLAIAFTALIVAFNPSVVGAANPVVQIRAAELAQAYLEEIIGKRFDENTNVGARRRCGAPGNLVCSVTMGPEGESRAQYDDVDDYNGLVEQPLNPLGDIKAGYDSFTISIYVSYAGNELGLQNTAAKRIDVLIQGQNSQAITVSSYKTNF